MLLVCFLGVVRIYGLGLVGLRLLSSFITCFRIFMGPCSSIQEVMIDCGVGAPGFLLGMLILHLYIDLRLFYELVYVLN